VKKKSIRYLEACADELRKWLGKCVESREEAFAGLYLCLCQRPRLDAVLSKDPQLRSVRPATLAKVQELFRLDVEEAFEKKLAASKMSLPPREWCSAARAEADRRVSEWLLGADAESSL